MACHTGLQENILINTMRRTPFLSSGARRVRRPGYSVTLSESAMKPATPSASHSNFFWRLATLLLVVHTIQKLEFHFTRRKRKKNHFILRHLDRGRTRTRAISMYMTHTRYMPRHMHMGSFGAPASAAELSCKTEAEVTVVSSSSSQHAPHYN